ncbi:conserved hypothetical protein [Vibrio chagasii]|nr:conserved hypothetical protein [Vibrio chagasii]
MKKCFVSLECPPYGGGAGVYFYELCKMELDDVDYITHFRSKSVFANNVIFFCFPAKLWFLWGPIYLIYLYFKYDKVLLNDVPFIYSLGVIPKFMADKFSIIIHGEERRISSRSFLDRFFFFRKRYISALENAKSVIFVSEYMKSKTLQVLEVEDKSNYIVIHNATPAKSTCELVKGKNVDSLKIITVARLTAGKGVFELVKELSSFISSLENITWDIYGDGEEYCNILDFIQRAGLSDKILLHGFISKEQLVDKYLESDCFVLASRLRESFGLVYLEAASAGLPVIGVDKYGASEAMNYIYNFIPYDVNVVEELRGIYSSKSVKNGVSRTMFDLKTDILRYDLL